MSVFKRSDSKYWWYKFTFNGKRYQRPTKVANKRKAETIEAAFRTRLANGEVGIEEMDPAPALSEFSKKFIKHVETQHASKPETIRFYANRMKRLLEWEPLQTAKLDRIDAGLIARYISQRRNVDKVGIVSVNRELATLRRALHLAEEWKVIRRAPKVKLLPGEPGRDWVLEPQAEQAYLAACPPLLRDVAVLLLDTGLRVGEALALEWSAIHLQPVGAARHGWLEVREGKSKAAQRAVPITTRVKGMLSERQTASKSNWVFPGDSPDLPVLGTSLAHMHAKVCRPGKGKSRLYKFPAQFVLHSLRHTALTRLGEAGADAFTIKTLAGHSSVAISQRYVHPTPETVELAYDRLEALNRKALASFAGGGQ